MPERRSDAPANRNQLIEAARRVFAERGIAAEVKDIAAEAGLGIGTFYRNFPRKEDLILALLQEADDLMAAAFEEAAAGDRTGVERIQLIVARLFDTERRFGWLADALWTGQLPKEWLDRSDDDHKRDLFNAFIQQGVDEGTIRPDIEPALIIAMLMGPIVLRSRLLVDLEPKDATETLLPIILRGIAPHE